MRRHRVSAQVYPCPRRHRDVDPIIDHDPRPRALGGLQHGFNERDEFSRFEVSLSNMNKVDASRDRSSDLPKQTFA